MAVNYVYQYSTASALMAGVASNGIPVSDLLLHGSHGLGTMAQINGEVVVVDGTAYHLQSDGSARIVEAHEELPFAVVTPFNAIQNKKADRFPAGLHNKSAILDCLIKLYSGGIMNRFAFFCLPDTTHFNHITVRVIRGQKYPGQPLSELGDSQKVDTYYNTRGSITGFWTPAFMDGVSIGGLHMHFLSSDRTYGGHVLELQTQEEVMLTAAVLNAFKLELPNNTQFDMASLGSGGGGEALHKVEG
jgi:alpha-acetolactate decarboxylase